MNPQTIRDSRQQARAEYDQATKGLIFTKDFQTRQEALMHDPLATVGERVMAWILRRSWGEYCLYAVRDDGEPAYQRDCVKELGLDKTSVSHAVGYYQRRGYLEDQPKLLYPIISPALVVPDPNCKEVAGYATFLQSWKVAHSTENQKWEDARSTDKFFRELVRSEYKKSRTSGTNGGPSLYETEEIKKETSSSSAFSSGVEKPQPDLQQTAEEEEKEPLYQKFKTNYPEGHFDEPKAKPSFEKKNPAQQAHVLERLQVYVACERWQDEDGRWIPLASKWLESYDADPPPLLKKKGNGRSVIEAFMAGEG